MYGFCLRSEYINGNTGSFDAVFISKENLEFFVDLVLVRHSSR